MLLGGDRFPLDLMLHNALYAGNDPVLSRNALLLTRLGSAYALIPIALAAALYLYFKRRMRAALLLIIVFMGRLLVELQKVIVDRDRPGLSPHLEAAHSMSFPSGHATNAMITFLAIAILLPVRQRNRAIAVGIAIAVALQVGWSRVAIGVHWPSDVLGGWAFGLLWIAICLRLASARPDAEPSGGAR
jgi:undecaprenyl-diphosphatase